MSSRRERPCRPRLAALVLVLAASALSGCVVGPVAGAAVGVAATTVKTGVHVAGAVGGAAVDAGGAVLHAATGGPRH